MPYNPIRDLLRHRTEMAERGNASSVFIIGLGRFGSALAETLIELGAEVLAVDSNPELVAEWAPKLTHVREADATSVDTLRQLGVTEFDVAVVAIGSHLEASILTTAALLDVGVSTIWAKAVQDDHGRILDRVGAHHVIYPEREMGMRAAHAISGRVIDYFELDDGFALAEVRPPASLIGLSLAEANVRERYGVTIVAVKPMAGSFTYALAETVINEGDILAIAGESDRAAEFAKL